MRASRRLLALPLVLAAVGAGLGSPARGEVPPPPGPAVKGLHQAFRAATYTGPPQETTGEAAAATYYFAGTPDAGRLVDAAPVAGAALTQQASDTGDTDRVGDPAVASWRLDTSGPMRGALELTWWWSSPTPTLNDEVIAISAIADPGTDRERVVGRTETTVRAGFRPERNVTTLRLDADVAESLLIQVRPVWTSDSETLLVHYGAPSTPSQATFRATALASGRQQNAQIRYTGTPLTVQAHSVERDAAEPTIGVDADGVAFMAAGAFDALDLPIGLARTEIKRSTDGGKSWESVQTTTPADLTTVPPTTLDPYVYLDEDTGRVFTPDLYVACNYLQFSDDKGETWTQSPVACGQPGVNDHQTVVTGPPPEGQQSLGIYPNYVYYCFNRVADASCGRSLDGGLTFLPAGQPAFLGVNDDRQLCGGLHGHIVTDIRGNVYLPKGHCGFPWLAISEDGAQTWRTVQVNDQFGSAGTHLAVEVDDDGTIYYLWWTAEERVPLLARSFDSGRTWTEPLLVAPPGVMEVNFPTIDVGKPGQIAISFPGTTVDRNTDDPNVDPTSRPWNYYVMTSLDADSASPTFVSTTAQPLSDPIHRGNCGPGRCAGMFDFIDVEITPTGDIWAAATDTCTDEAGCNTADGARAPSALGIAIRSLSGPGLPGAAPAPAAPAPPVSRPAPRPVPAPLPATGVPAALAWLGLLVGGAALVVRRRRVVAS